MASNRKTALQRKEEIHDADDHDSQPKVAAISNALKIKLDHLKGFEPLTDNQKLFYDMYNGGGYFISLLGSPGTGKCQGEDVEVNLLVSDELYEKLTHLT